MADTPGDFLTGFSFGGTPPQIARCPYCDTGRPQVAALNDYGMRGKRRWSVYTVTCCGGVLLAQGQEGDTRGNAPIERLYAETKRAAPEIPEPAQNYLRQAFETLHAPDAAAVMAGSAVDAMLKHLKLVDGSVYDRIGEAVSKNLITAGMGKWAHEVRLGSNRPRHSDKENPHVSPNEARQSVEFAEALGHFLFVLSSRVKKGIADAKKPVRGQRPTRGSGGAPSLSKAT